MNLFDILENNSIIHSDKECGIFFTWNGSCTLHAWKEISSGEYDLLNNSAIRTYIDHCEDDYSGAIKRVKIWLKEIIEDE